MASLHSVPSRIDAVHRIVGSVRIEIYVIVIANWIGLHEAAERRVVHASPVVIEPDLGRSAFIQVTDSELRAIARLPETVRLVIDYHHVQEAQAEAVGAVECMKHSENRRKELEPLRDELLAKRCEAPGEIRFISPRQRTLKRIRFLFAPTTYCEVVEVAISNFFTWLEDRPASEREADAS